MDQKVLEHIKAKISLVPLKPGCYQMYNRFLYLIVKYTFSLINRVFSQEEGVFN